MGNSQSYLTKKAKKSKTLSSLNCVAKKKVDDDQPQESPNFKRGDSKSSTKGTELKVGSNCTDLSADVHDSSAPANDYTKDASEKVNVEEFLNENTKNKELLNENANDKELLDKNAKDTEIIYECKVLYKQVLNENVKGLEVEDVNFKDAVVEKDSHVRFDMGAITSEDNIGQEPASNIPEKETEEAVIKHLLEEVAVARPAISRSNTYDISDGCDPHKKDRPHHLLRPLSTAKSFDLPNPPIRVTQHVESTVVEVVVPSYCLSPGYSSYSQSTLLLPLPTEYDFASHDDLSADETYEIQRNTSPQPKTKTSNWRKVKNVVQWTPFIQTYKRHKYPWVQLAGHQGNFKAGERQGTILKKLCPSEQKALDTLMTDRLCPFVPRYYGSVEGTDGDQFLELQDLLSDFSAPCVMDIKMGVRTYLEEELAKAREKPKLRKDMYEKMIQIDPLAPSEPEHRAQAVTKPRYMVWRETISSTATLGFRIEGVKKADGSSSKDFKTTRSAGQVLTSLRNFMLGYDHAPELYMKRLREIRATLDTSTFFKSHELIGSSLLFVHNEDSAVVWLIDFAKSVPLPLGVCTSHLLPWSEGSHEDGYLLGLDNLIDLMLQLMNEINLRKGLALKMRTAKDWERSETPTKETTKTDVEDAGAICPQSGNGIDSEPLNIQENESATTGEVYSGNNDEIHSETLNSRDIHSVSFNIKEDDSESSNSKKNYSEPADNNDNDLETVDVGNIDLEDEDTQDCDLKAVDFNDSETIGCKDNKLKTVSNGDICLEAINDYDNNYSMTNTENIIALMTSKNVEIDIADSSSEISLEKDTNLNFISNIVNSLESNIEVNSPLDDKGSDQMNDNQTELNQNFTNTDQELYIHDTYVSSINLNTHSCEESNSLDTDVNLEESLNNKIEKSSIVQNNVSEVVSISNNDENLLESSKKSGDIRKLVSLNCDTNSIS